MKKILAFAGSNSSASINHMLVQYVASEIKTTEARTIKLTDYEIPMYDIDVENEKGIPIDVMLLKNEIAKQDGLIISVNEHNGSLSAFFKNTIDWLSRSDRNIFEGKKILLMSTSPGARGGATALEYAKGTLPRFGGAIVESFSFPSFQDNFDMDAGVIKNPTLQLGIGEVIASFLQELDV